jgi:hypothetical protein
MSNLSIVIPSEVKGVFSLRKTNPKQTTTRRANSMGLDPAHRTPRRFRLADPFHFVILSEAKNLLFGLHHAAVSSHVRNDKAEKKSSSRSTPYVHQQASLRHS